MKIKRNQLILIIMLIVFILTIFFQLFWLKEGTTCINNPLVYGVNKYTKSNGVDMSCSCSLEMPNSPQIYVSTEEFFVLSITGEPFNRS